MRFTRLVVIAWAFFATPAFAEDCLEFSVQSGSQALENYAEGITKSLSEGSICATFTPLPSERATKMLQAGVIDGELARVKDYEEIISNYAVMVPTVIAAQSGYLVTHKEGVSSLRELRDQGLTVGIMRGWVWMNEYVESIYGLETYLVNTEESLIEMFARRRVDAILILEASLQKHHKLKRYNAHKILSLTGHIWLHKKHAHLVEKIDAIVADYVDVHGFFVPTAQ